MLHLDPPLSFEAGDRVRLVTTYDNQTNDTIRFGLLSSDEMQFMFYMYFTGELPTSLDDDEETPTTFQLSQNYPNPFNPTTTIEYYVPVTSRIKIRVYDMLGKEVRLLANKTVTPGSHTVQWDAANLPSGVYLINMETGSTVLTRTAFLIK